MQAMKMRHPCPLYGWQDHQLLFNMSNLQLAQKTAEVQSFSFDLIRYFVEDDQRLESSCSAFDILSPVPDFLQSTITDDLEVQSSDESESDFELGSPVPGFPQSTITGFPQSNIPDDFHKDDWTLQISDESDIEHSPSPGSSNPLSNHSAPSPNTEVTEKKRDKRIRKKPLEAKTLLSQCILQWLNDPEYNPDAITWLSKKDGQFLITDSPKIASLWGSKKGNKKKMNHEKLSRALRHYYKDGTLIKVPNKKRLCYRFSESAMKKFRSYFAEQ